MKNFVNSGFVFVNNGRIEIITDEMDDDPEKKLTRTPIDKDEINQKIDDMIEIITEKLEYLAFRYELDALKFFGGYIIDYALIV